MMAGKSRRPTDAELQILRLLWSRGPSTVREVHEALATEKNTSYNTTLKLMQIMNEKGTVIRDESRRPQIYRARVPEAQMQRGLMSEFLDRVFGGSARKLMAALTANDISNEELAEIRQMLDGLQEEQR